MTSDRSFEKPVSRRAVLGGLLGAMLLPEIAGAMDTPVNPPLIGRDYARERQTFHTHLLTRGPAPDKYEPLDPPANAERIFYRSGRNGNLQLAAWVSKHQPSHKLRPAVLFLHGGNAMGAGHWTLMRPYIDSGYVVMMPTVRGENGQAGAFSGFYNEVSDVLAAGEHLAGLPGVDGERLFLAGHSIGGTLAMLSAMASNRFRAAVPISGNPNAFRFFRRYPEDIRFDDSDIHEFEVRTALCYAQSLKCPTYLMHGTKEPHLNQGARLMEKRAKAAGLPIQASRIEGDHTTALPHAISRSIGFFRSVSA
ncbi:alpha/beta fold hydrolase [Rhizobium cremeum]|uniref:alpha/beta hydrolase family protein n=1 Tax=Rhizobium cremeum TaxID=2813827 RepID=UPI000DD8E4EF|nr:alpha/beta fold hydrolase [Rhizobium cremeum]MCJ7996282.1 alpha/beta fold hydrolase [Rhizobium cremeum]MCJ8001541.1 alpha/beta fold hydrolase [Rhizobium cremeum]